MSKRKAKRWRKVQLDRKSRRSRQRSDELQRTFNWVDRLISQGRAQEAVGLLEPLLDSHPRLADLHYYLGYARVKAGDLWRGLEGYEQAIELSGEPSYWFPLASLYMELELNAHALRAVRQVLKQQPDHPMIDQVREMAAFLEQSLQTMARRLDLPLTRAEEGLYELDRGQRALRTGDYPACIAANRRAIKLIPHWLPPYNNLSLALFFDGQPEEAIATAHQVLSIDPNNIQALSNAIRFLAWTGQEPEARTLWPRLQEITPQDAGDRLKMSEAAAVLSEDEDVYQLLKPLDKASAAQAGPPGFVRHAQLFLAVAEANTGRSGAQRRLKALQNDEPWAGELLAALKTKKPGPGWAERFPYYRNTDLITGRAMEEFAELLGQQDDVPPKKFQRQMARFAARFPQIVRVAEKLIWEENQPQLGIDMLAAIATPAAYTALRRFGLSQAGDDEIRLQALSSLMQAGEIAEDETLRLWHQGEWREVQLRQYKISDEAEPRYTPEVADLLNQGLQAFQQGDYQQAERLFRRALKLDPKAKEACNNLGTIYARRKKHKQAKDMFQAALDIDPTYVFPRCNLIMYLLDEDDIEGAEAMLAPLANVPRFHSQEMAFYSYVQARILTYREKYEEARQSLRTALEILPDYEPAKSLLDRLDSIIPLQKGFKSFMERQHQRDQAKRKRLQAKLTTSAPSLSEVLPLYSKDALTGMARVVIPWDGWTGLRKAELIQQIVDALTDRDRLKEIVDDLQDDEQAALRQVLAEGGSMAWPAFDARYDNDLEESAYWNWHQPQTTMGHLRLRGLLAEAVVEGELLVVVPAELRQLLGETF